MKKAIFIALLLLSMVAQASNLTCAQHVFVIVLENHAWSEFKGATNAPFLNTTLLPMAAHCEQYYNPPGLHPSEPNYLWLEAGTNFGIFDDNDPADNHLNTTNHLAAQLNRAGISWKSYQEDIGGDVVPLSATNAYAPRHNPFVYFDDLTGTNNPNDAFGIAHNRPLSELFADLTNNFVARYNFITPNLCDDGHDSCEPQNDSVKQSDDFLAMLVPKILLSSAYSNGGALFITWDEAEGGSDGPIGMMLLSPLARGGGYASNQFYTHSSFVRTIQEIFSLSPWLGDAANAADLSDLFAPYAVSIFRKNSDAPLQISVGGTIPGSTNVLQSSTNLVSWKNLFTNVSVGYSFTFTNTFSPASKAAFYRTFKLP